MSRLSQHEAGLLKRVLDAKAYAEKHGFNCSAAALDLVVKPIEWDVRLAERQKRPGF